MTMIRDYNEIAAWLRRCNARPWPWRVIREAFKRTADGIRREQMPPTSYRRQIEAVCGGCGAKHTDSSYDCSSCMRTA